jgi:MotA/TolQ/ExbB proton channel family
MDEWSIGCLWRCTYLMERLVLTALALMLIHIVVVVTRVSYRCYLARRTQRTDTAGREFQRSRRKLIAELSLWVGTLNSSASTAPYLGLAGTCLGILDNLSVGYAGSRQGFFVVMFSRMAAAFLSTAGGLLVAIPATVSHNCLRKCLEALRSEVSKDVVQRDSPHFQVAQKLPLAARFSTVPFALIAAPALVGCVGAFMTFSFGAWDIPMGLAVGIAPVRCVDESDNRFIVLRLTNANNLFINQERVDWDNLGSRSSQIYSLRVDRTLYLLAEDGVPFQSVARALDIVENTRRVNLGSGPVLTLPDRLDLTVQLLTPKALSALCLEPVSIGPSLHALR